MTRLDPEKAHHWYDYYEQNHPDNYNPLQTITNWRRRDRHTHHNRPDVGAANQLAFLLEDVDSDIGN